MASYTAVVAGATGATGREFVRLLLQSPRCACVTVLVRSASRAAPKFERTAKGEPIDAAAREQKLKVVELDWEALCSGVADEAKKLAGHHVGVNCLGTTRKDAGGFKGWLRVDRDYYNAFTSGCKAQGVPSLVQVSWTGASPKSWLAQPRTKGECDAYAMAAGFQYLAVLRPGLLDRGDEARTIERVSKRLGVPVISVADVAAAGVAAFEAESKPAAAEVLENRGMRAAVAKARSAAGA